MSHAGYYPGGMIMTMKVVFEKGTYRLLGAQIVGYEGVDKRIDVLATAIRAGIKATDLKNLDLAYAPPYSSAKDPVNMAGFIIDNIANGLLKQWHLETLPCMALSGMDIQEEFPLIGEVGLAQCLTDSRYMRLIDTRAAECLSHNEECKNCEHALKCLCGCRAAALETTPDDILAIDTFTCKIFRQGWVEKIHSAMKKIRPEAKGWGLDD